MQANEKIKKMISIKYPCVYKGKAIERKFSIKIVFAKYFYVYQFLNFSHYQNFHFCCFSVTYGLNQIGINLKIKNFQKWLLFFY